MSRSEKNANLSLLLLSIILLYFENFLFLNAWKDKDDHTKSLYECFVYFSLVYFRLIKITWKNEKTKKNLTIWLRYRDFLTLFREFQKHWMTLLLLLFSNFLFIKELMCSRYICTVEDWKKDNFQSSIQSFI